MWKAVSYGSGARHWYVAKGSAVATDARGLYRRFASYEAAQRAAIKLNDEAKEGSK